MTIEEIRKAKHALANEVMELFARYRAYVKAGFTEQQALELCCKRP